MQEAALFLVAEEDVVVLQMQEIANVYTLGKNASLENLLWSPDILAQRGIEVVRCDRGGQVTAHMPGQLVCYILLDMRKFSFGVKFFVKIIEESVICLLKSFGIAAHTDDAFPGVWVGTEKICAIGLKIAKHTSSHGLSLNIHNDLNLYQGIRPCGISDRGVTSMHALTQQIFHPSEIATSLASILEGKLLAKSRFAEAGNNAEKSKN